MNDNNDTDSSHPGAAPGIAPRPGSGLDRGEGSASPGLPDALAGGLALLRAGFAQVSSTQVRSLDGREGAVLVRELGVLADQLHGLALQALARVEADGFWALDGLHTFPTWLAWHEQISIAAARRMTRLARALRDELPATNRALADADAEGGGGDADGGAGGVRGRITVEHAQIIATVAATSDTRRAALIDPDNPCNEQFLLTQARNLSVDQFRAVTRRWAAAADPAADDRGYTDALDREYVELSATLDGYHLAGFLTTENGLLLATALRAVQGIPTAGDLRSPAQRRAGSLRDLCRLTLDHGLAGTGSAVRPSISVLVPYDTLTALAPTEAAQFETGQPIPRAALQRLTCDASVHRIVFGPDDQILNVGRTKRTFTGLQRRAIIARDKHCQYPTCTAPPALCEVHHTDHWAHGGDTNIATGILLCWHHHTHTHTHNITITRTTTGTGTWQFTNDHGHIIDQRLANRRAAS